MAEKPITTSRADTRELIQLAGERGLALHENYMFQYHSQIARVREEIAKKTIGELRLIRIDFGFPFRGAGDFRYDRALGGGALLDCAGYTVKLAALLLGESARVAHAQLCGDGRWEVDLYGDGVMVNDAGLTAQLAFGMDNSYRCDLDLWGSAGSLRADRILTAPDGFAPSLWLKTGTEVREIKLESDDAFGKSLEFFHKAIHDPQTRTAAYSEIARQAELMERFKEMAGRHGDEYSFKGDER
jgi:predicted dehydrogenase